MVPLELSKDNNQYCKISVFMPNAGSINESVISVTNVGGDSFSVAVSMIRWNANKVFCKLINGTKISNINMYYTVDTERFCFYIKANWYAKIIVSRLGLVNTSKIESINAIPSGAIEVPISWRDKRYSTELGELIGIATKENKGLSDSVQALNSTIYNISTGNKETALFKVCDYGSNINHILHIYSSPNGTLDSCNYIRVILSDKYIFVNKLFEKGYNSIRLFKDRKSFYVYVYSSVWTRTKIEVFSENPDLFYFTNVTDEISISDLEEISISWKI